MALTLTLLAGLVVVGLLLVARYGADSRPSGDPTGRDAAWPASPVREHTPGADLALVRAWIARTRAHRRCWELFERTLTPWEAPTRPTPTVRARSSSA
jgi:hypothetical protein